MMVLPMETWPSAAMTTESPRRTQMTVVERMRRPSPKSKGWAREGVSDFRRVEDLDVRLRDEFMGNFQYTARPSAQRLMRVKRSL